MWGTISNLFVSGSSQFSPATASDYFLQARLYKERNNIEAAQQAYDIAIHLAEAEVQTDIFSQAKENTLIDLYLEYANFLNEYRQSKDKVKTLCDSALQRVDAKQQRFADAPQEKKALLKVYGDWLNILVNCDLTEEAFNLSQKISTPASSPRLTHASRASTALSISSTSTSTQISQSTKNALLQQPSTSAAQTKGRLVNHLFEKMISTLGALKLSDTPSLFLVYAHDNASQGQAEASTSRYLIDKLSQIRVLNLYSDQTPIGQSSSLEGRNHPGKMENILTSQLCLLPTQLQNGVQPVDKVVVCCSEVLGNYLQEWPHFRDFQQALQKAYYQDRKQRSTQAIREVVRKFSEEAPYREGFHHVLTEMAFLQIRAKELEDEHGIIPVPLTPNSYERCLSDSIRTTTVRIGDIPRLDRHVQAGHDIYPNQDRHAVLFKLIERLLVGNDEAKIFLDKFWQGYGNLLSWLKNEPTTSTFGEHGLELVKLVDDIFDDVEKELNKKLFSTAQQFCNAGWQQATIQLLDQLQNLFPVFMQQAEALQKLFPSSFSSIELREALRRYYDQSDLSIQRVSGDKVSLNDCYINLAIVESQAQQEKDKVELENQAKSFERLPSGDQLEATNINKLISLDQLFAKQKLRDGSEAIPQRILIQGRAGIGKTTLCKKLVYEFHHNKLWQDQFDCVLWVPLRQLKAHHLTRFEELFCKYYFTDHKEDRAKALATALYDHRDKTLFVLDGLDEVIDELDERLSLKKFLQHLLDQKHVIITSRPAGVDTQVLGKLDLQLETIGFSQKDVQTYIEKFVPQLDQVEIQQFINSTPVVQSLVNIPIQLDALCYSWDRLPKDQSITMSMLYDAMVDKLWRKDAIRSEKHEKGKLVAARLIQKASKAQLEKLMRNEIDYLGYLAFKGLTQGRIEFSVDELDQCQEEIEESLSGKELSLSFIDDLKKTSYLHTVDTEQDETKRHYHFLHLTFQEFFAAKFLTKNLQAYAREEISYVPTHLVQNNLGVIPEHNELVTFIATNKYNSRYEIVWWMVAGLLKDAALENFFKILDQVPQDLIGGRHQQLMIGCLNEARSQLNQAKILELEQTFKRSLHFEMKWNENGLSELGRQTLFPEHLLLEELNQFDSKKEQIIKILGTRSILSEKAIFDLIDLLKNENKAIKDAVVEALSEQKILSKAAMSKLKEVQLNSDEAIKSAVNKVLDAHSTRPDAAILRLINKLSNQDTKIKVAAAQALAKQKNFSQKAISALTDGLQDNNRQVRFEVTKALMSQKKLPKTTMSNLIQLLQNERKSESKKVTYEVIDLLGEQEKQTEAAISILCDMLKDDDRVTTQRAILALCKQNQLSETVILALTEVLRSQDNLNKMFVVIGLKDHKMRGKLPPNIISAFIDMLKDEEIRPAAIQILGQQNTLSDTAISALCQLLQDKDYEVKSMADGVLKGHNTLPTTSILNLSAKLRDKSESVRADTADKLSAQKNLPQPVISMLIDTLKDPSEKVRVAAVKALYLQKTLSEAIISTFDNVILGGDKAMRAMAGDAFVFRETLPEAAVSLVLKTLQDEDKDVRDASALILGKHGKLPETAISIVCDKLQDKNENIRFAFVGALTTNSQLPETAVFALRDLLQDKNVYVRSNALLALSNQKILPESVISALVNFVKSNDGVLKMAALNRLSNEETQPENAIPVWIQVLKDENESIRNIARKILRDQKKLSETNIYTLVDLLKSGNDETKHGAVLALEKQETLPKDVISVLINALQEKHKVVIYWAVKALGKQERLSDDATDALRRVLEEDDDALNRTEAAKALSNQKELSDEIISVLNDALEKEKEWGVKEAIASTLCERATLPQASTFVLIKLLQDNDEKVRSLAAWVLSCHLNELYKLLPGLSTEQVQFLYTKVLFPQSCKKITSLIVQRNQIQFDTVTGQRHSIDLEPDQIKKVIEDLLPVRTEAGVAP